MTVVWKKSFFWKSPSSRPYTLHLARRHCLRLTRPSTSNLFGILPETSDVPPVDWRTARLRSCRTSVLSTFSTVCRTRDRHRYSPPEADGRTPNSTSTPTGDRRRRACFVGEFLFSNFFLKKTTTGFERGRDRNWKPFGERLVSNDRRLLLTLTTTLKYRPTLSHRA